MKKTCMGMGVVFVAAILLTGVTGAGAYENGLIKSADISAPTKGELSAKELEKYQFSTTGQNRGPEEPGVQVEKSSSLIKREYDPFYGDTSAAIHRNDAPRIDPWWERVFPPRH